MLIPHKGHTDTIQVYSVTVMTHVKALQAGHSSQGTSEPITPVQSGEDWIARLDDDLSQPAEISGDSFRISALQREDPVCITLHAWIVADEFPPWAEVKSMLPELRSLWHHRNNLSIDTNGTIWRKRSSQSALLQLLVPKAGRERLFLSYHASLYGGHLGRTRTLARLADRFYWSGMSDDVKDWLGQCVWRASNGNHRWVATTRWAIFPLVTVGIG